MKKKAFQLIGMGFEAVILLGFFIYIGSKGDIYFDTKGWLTAGGVILALCIWFYRLFCLIKDGDTEI